MLDDLFDCFYYLPYTVIKLEKTSNFLTSYYDFDVISTVHRR